MNKARKKEKLRFPYEVTAYIISSALITYGVVNSDETALLAGLGIATLESGALLLGKL